MAIKRRLVRIAPMQLGKMLAALQAAMGLIFIPFFGIFFLITTFIPKQPNMQMPPTAVFAGFGLLFLVAIPIFYGVMGFITGIVGAAIYNLFAKWIGGIEVEVE